MGYRERGALLEFGRCPHMVVSCRNGGGRVCCRCAQLSAMDPSGRLGACIALSGLVEGLGDEEAAQCAQCCR